jgi:glutamate 5-kinase
VDGFKKEIEQFAGNIPGALGRGGMLSKIKAAKKVTAAGVPMIIARGTKPDILLRLFAGEPMAPILRPKEKNSRRKCWIAYTLTPKGNLMMDAGAEKPCCAGARACCPAASRAPRGPVRRG